MLKDGAAAGVDFSNCSSSSNFSHSQAVQYDRGAALPSPRGEFSILRRSVAACQSNSM